MDINKKPIYPVEPWNITETEFSMETNYRNETTFALSNGYIGTRGTFEEGYDFSVDEGLEGNFINGFYESVDIPYGEWNYGFPTKSQSLLNLPDLKKTEIYGDGELFDMRTGKVEDYREKAAACDEALCFPGAQKPDVPADPDYACEFFWGDPHLFPSEWRCGESYQKDQSSDRLRSFWKQTAYGQASG